MTKSVFLSAAAVALLGASPVLAQDIAAGPEDSIDAAVTAEPTMDSTIETDAELTAETADVGIPADDTDGMGGPEVEFEDDAGANAMPIPAETAPAEADAVEAEDTEPEEAEAGEPDIK